MTKIYSRSDRRAERDFPMVPMLDGDGRTLKGFRITCAECGATEQRLRSNAYPGELFAKVGWEVGNNERHDRCPACVKGKVIHMAEHKKPEPATERTTMSREDARLLSRTIEDHWDEVNGCYQMGWSDTKLADDAGVPIDWVKAIRERDFGGTGEDPTLVAFVAAQVEVKREAQALVSALQLATAKLEESTMWHTELARKMEGYRNTARRLVERTEGLEEIAHKIEQSTGFRITAVVPKKAG